MILLLKVPKYIKCGLKLSSKHISGTSGNITNLCEYFSSHNKDLKKVFMNTNSASNFKKWNPQQTLNGEDSFALLLLNQPVNIENKAFLKQNWNSAIVRVAVDGGANQLKDMFDKDMSLPDIICGDFDSALPSSLEFFREKGALIVPTPDQDETDFTKGLKLTLKYLKENKLQASSIVVIVRNGERLDHIFGNLNTLYFAAGMTSIPVFILGNGTLTWLLTVGSHKILVPDKMRDSNIGIIPLGKECSDVTSTGLKWNLTHDKMKFGGLISTSNSFGDDKEVTINTDTELIWTMEIKMS